MARQDNNKSRVTPKGTKSTLSAEVEAAGGAASRMNREPEKLAGPSPVWVPVLMGVGLVGGTLMIFLNYLLPFMENNWYLIGGLGLVLAGIMAATQYR